MRFPFSAALSAIALAGCATTDPQSAASIEYRLPRTDASLSLALELQGCDPQPVVLAQLTATAREGSQDQLFQVSGAQLASSRIERSFTMTLFENGVIKTINSQTSERTAAIIANTLKTVSTIVGAGSPFTGQNALPTCRPEVSVALQRAAVLREEIPNLQRELNRRTVAGAAMERRYRGLSDSDLTERINAFANELATLQTGVLSITTTARVNLGTESPLLTPTTNRALNAAEPHDERQFERWPRADLAVEPFFEWFNVGDVSSNAARRRAVELHQDAIRSYFDIRWYAYELPTTVNTLTGSESNSLRDCGFSIPMPNPVPIRVLFRGAGDGLEGLDTARLNTPAAQWNDPSQLCLDAGFGEKRTVALTFDARGTTTSFQWQSNAQAEAVTAAIASNAGTARSLVQTATADGPGELERQKAEIEALSTQQRLNELRHCRAVIEAGGFNCNPSN